MVNFFFNGCKASQAVRFERRCDFIHSFVYCSFAVSRSSSENRLFIDLNLTSKQHINIIHVTELTHQAREFCLKRAVNYISKGHGAIKPCFKLREQSGERRCDFPVFCLLFLQCFDHDPKIGFL